MAVTLDYVEKNYNHLIGMEIELKGLDKNGIKNKQFVSAEIIQSSLNSLIGRKKGMKGTPYKKMSDGEIVASCIDDSAILSNAPAVMNLQPGKNDSNSQPPVKFEDIRKMDLSLESLNGYEEQEKNFVQQRLSELSEDFNLEKTTDKFLAYRVALCELKIMQLETLSVMNKKENVESQKQIEILDKQYKGYCESLNALKRQRDNAKERPKEATDLTGAINQLDKSIEDMKKEIGLEKRQEQEMTRKLMRKDKNSKEPE